MQRFYFEKTEVWELFSKKFLEIKNDDFFHQISRVLRSRIWDQIIIFNWDSFDYIYEIENINSKWIKLIQLERIENIWDYKKEINLYQALPNKYEKIESIIQKWVEIGISNFIFFNSERSQKLVINEKKKERFDFIAKEALEQCNGNKKPNIMFIDKLPILTSISWEKLVLHTKKQNSISLSELDKNLEKINLFIWPEWGFSEKEIWVFEANHCKIINFWERILRTETAWIVAWFYLLNS